jgi:hypothetical protein
MIISFNFLCFVILVKFLYFSDFYVFAFMCLKGGKSQSSVKFVLTKDGVQPSLIGSSKFHGSDCEAVHRRRRRCPRKPYVTGRGPARRLTAGHSSALQPNLGDGEDRSQYATAHRFWLWLHRRIAFSSRPPARPGPRRCMFRRTALRCLRAPCA